MEKITGNEPINAIQPTFNSEGQICNERFAFEGLTIRQHFAAMAMWGLLASNDVDAFGAMSSVAEQAVVAADALIKELNKTSNP